MTTIFKLSVLLVGLQQADLREPPNNPWITGRLGNTLTIDFTGN
jgi:hypothetical protein